MNISSNNFRKSYSEKYFEEYNAYIIFFAVPVTIYVIIYY